MVAKLAVLSFSDGRERVHQDLLPYIERVETQIINTLKELGIECIKGKEVINSNESAVWTAEELLKNDFVKNDFDGLILNIPVFAFPNYVLIALKSIDKPVLVYSPPN